MRFEEFLDELLEREGVGLTGRDLVGVWGGNEKVVVTATLQAALAPVFATTDEFDLDPDSWAGATNQSKGNRIAAYIMARLSEHPDVTLREATGRGYPDYWLEISGRVYAVEMKATGNLKPGSTLRTVLLSTSRTLRKALETGMVSGPINHVLLQVEYENRPGAKPGYRSARLYFLEPDSEVNVRFEAATSQRRMGDLDSALL